MLFKNQNGQVLLIIVLIMVVGLTVGLSLASRSIVNLRTTKEDVTSQQALSAAEAGIEQVAKTGISIANGAFSNNTNYNATITAVSGNSFLLAGGNDILKDDSIDIWLSDYSTESAKLYQNQWSGDLNIYWGKANDGCSQAALEIIVISGDKSNPISKKYAFDPCASRANSNHFSSVGSGGIISNKNLPFGATLNVSNGILARIIPVYSTTVVGVAGSSALPSQGSIITSVGTSGSTTRKVTLFQGFPTLPSEYFPYGLFVP